MPSSGSRRRHLPRPQRAPLSPQIWPVSLKRVCTTPRLFGRLPADEQSLGFKQRFPEMYEDYEHRCQRQEVRLGQPYLYKQDNQPWVLNFPTKDHWRGVSRISDIARGLEFLAAHYRERGITSLAVQPGLTYRDAREHFKDHLREWVPMIEKVADLLLRFPSTADLEIGATALFVVGHFDFDLNGGGHMRGLLLSGTLS